MIPFTNQNFFFGVVEDINDPETNGRCKVRIVGIHSEDTTLVPTESLPWCDVASSPDNPRLGGRGKSPNGLLVGSCVGGIFADPEDKQQPIILCSFGGKRAPGGDTNAGAFNAMGTSIYNDDRNSGCISADPDPTTPTNNNSMPASGEAKWMTYAQQELSRGIRQDRNPDRVLEYSKITGVNSRTAAWCSSFVCWCLEQAGVKSSRSGMARGNISHGALRDVANLADVRSGKVIPPYGSIIVIPRGAEPSGHVCFSMGTGGNGKIKCLHGNWGWSKYGTGAVIVDNVTASQVLAARWPTGAASPDGSAPVQRAYNTDCTSSPTEVGDGGSTGTPVNASGAEKALIDAMTAYGITNPTERRMLWAQCAHESGGFKNMTELPSKYASSRDRYKGRGMCQVTGEDNYRALSKHVGQDLIKDPDWITRTVENNVKATLSWWVARDLGAPCRPYAIKGDIDGVSFGINKGPFSIGKRGGRQALGIEDRRKWWAKAQTMKI